MKYCKLLFALLAVLLVAVPGKSDQRFTQSWFSYIGGSKADPNNYRQCFIDPGCTGHNLCAIRILIDWSLFRPDYNALQALYNESSQMTSAGSYVDGVVELKP